MFGGSQGARSINHAALDGLLRPGRPFHVLHISGTRDYDAAASGRVAEPARAASTTRCSTTSPGSPTRWPPATWSSPVPGASVFELAAAGRPAILVPYPYATGRHQHANAEWMASAGAAR